MSITLDIMGRTSGTWGLSSNCIAQIERLRTTAAQPHVEAIFGDADTGAGMVRKVRRATLVDAADRLLSVSGKIPMGFQIRIPPLYGATLPSVGRGVGGVLINGKYHVIDCWDDHWTFQPTEELQRGTAATPRYEPAQIQTDNMGTITVEVKRSKRSDLARLLHDLRRFLDADASEEFDVVWG